MGRRKIAILLASAMTVGMVLGVLDYLYTEPEAVVDVDPSADAPAETGTG